MHKIVKEDIEWILNQNLPFSRFEGKTILVSGANGFLPSYMVETLLYYNTLHPSNRCKVIGLVRNLEKAKKRFCDYAHSEDLELIEGDVSFKIDYNFKIDFIIHAASQASPKYYGIDPVGTLLPNIIGTYNLLEIAKIQQVEGFLYFSSSEIYGNVETKSIKEDFFGSLDPMIVRSCYGEGKRAGESLCKSYAIQYGLDIKVVRPFHTYGPNMSLDDGRVFADFVRDVVNKENIKLNSNGLAKRAFCYLRDATDGFFRVMLNGESGEAYNIANDKEVISIKELAYTLANLFPEFNLSVLENKQITITDVYLKSHIEVAIPDIQKSRKMGFNPNTNIANGFKRTILSYKTI